ncbi:MAG: hypothetical protein WCB31_10650 [Nitrososphaeraceae archaeon]
MTDLSAVNLNTSIYSYHSLLHGTFVVAPPIEGYGSYSSYFTIKFGRQKLSPIV